MSRQRSVASAGLVGAAPVFAALGDETRLRLVRSPLVLLLLLLLDLGIRPEDFPMVAVEVVEAPAVHEAVVLRIHGVLSAGGDGLVHHSVHLRPAAAREREERLRVLRRIAE